MALKRATSPQCDGVVTLLPSLMKKLEHVETPPWTRFLVGPIDMRLAVMSRQLHAGNTLAGTSPTQNIVVRPIVTSRNEKTSYRRIGISYQWRTAKLPRIKSTWVGHH